MRIKTAKCLGTLQAIFLLLICTTAFAQVSWTKLPGAAMDIGAGPDGSVWVVGANVVQGGYDIYRWDGTNWQRVPGGATRIAVGPNGPWIINNSNNIFRWTGSGWQMTPGAAQDIGVGADGTAWVIGMDDAPYRWDGSNWSSIGGGAIQIAVDPKGDPWVVNRADQIYHHSAAGWEMLPGAAKDITVGADGVVYVVGTGATPGGFRIYSRAASGGDWKEEPGIAGVRIAAGPAGKVYVVQDAASGNAIMSRLAAPSMPTTISGTITTSIPVTQNPQVVPAPSGTTSTSGTLVVGASPVPTTNTTPIVVQSYTSYPPPNLNLAKGSIICPIIEAGPKLTKGCLFVGQPAIFLANAPSNDCASGSFFDPENGGECWSCPSGFIRNVSPVTAKDACWKAVSEDLKSATNVGSTGCSSGSFSDPRNGGECWSCPSGYMRTLVPVTDGKACAKDLIVGPWSAATYIKKPGSCTGDSFFDPIDGGSCWTCPSGYRRTANPVNGTAACAQTISTQYSVATLVSGCAQYASFAYGTPFRDPRGGGQCWACPNQLKRSAAEVNSTATGNAAACVVGSNTEDVFWQSPQFPEPGMFPFMDNLVTLAFKDPKRVDAFIQKRANGDPQKRRDLWEKMRSAPHDSPEYKALLFAALVTAANQGSTAPGFLSVGAFENYIRTRRSFVANDANDMYQAWKGVNSYNQYQAAKTASGISGMDTAVLGGIPSDYASLAWLAASPDQRGGAFMEAVDALGGYGASGVLGPDPSTPDGGFNSAYLLPVYKVIDKGLDKYKDWAVDTVSWGRISGKAFETAGKVVELGMIAVEKAVDLSIAITTIVNQEQAEHTYAQLVTDAQQPVSLHQMLTSGNDADLQQVMLYWALASSPYSSGPKAGTGQLTDAQMCADPVLGAKCKASYSIVTDAANAVQVWPVAAAPAPKPTIPESWEEARVTSIDTANSALHARMVDFGKAVIIPVGDPLLHSVTVGSIIYLNPGTHEASLDGKTACCRFTFDTSGKTLPN